MYYMSLGNKIKEQRLKCELTQSQLASILNVSNKTISSWENDRTILDINLIFKLANTLKTSLYTFINEESYNLDNLELEIKLKVDLKEWNRVLNIIEKDSFYLGNENHLTTYFKPQADTFKNQWLRIRNENGKYMLNYKKLIDNKCCNEYETIIDNQINLEKILECLSLLKERLF